MKNMLKKSIIFLILFSLVLSICNISKAEEGINIDTSLIEPRTTTDSDINPISADEIDSTDIDETEEIDGTEEVEGREEDENIEELGYHNDNFYSFSSQDVTIDESIYGDAFIMTSGNVTINASIYGSLFVMANDVTISDNAEIISSVFSLSKNLTLNGIIDTNLYSIAAQKITLSESSNITCDLYATARDIEINGTISRSIFSDSYKITVSENASILGNLNYTANEEITAPREVVAGDINYKRNDATDEEEKVTIGDTILSIISYMLLATGLYLIYKLFKLKFIKDPEFIKNNFVKCIIFGLISLIAIPIICIILVFIGALILSEIIAQLAMTLFTILLVLYIILLMLSVSTAIISLSQMIVNKFKEKITANITLVTILFICLLSIIYKLLLLVPIADSIVSIVLVVIGLGIWINQLLPNKE